MSTKAAVLEGLTPHQINVVALRTYDRADLKTIAQRCGGTIQNASKSIRVGLAKIHRNGFAWDGQRFVPASSLSDN